MPTIGVRAANPIWWLPDLVGQPLNDQYYISFLTNTFPYLPQPIFEDVNLTIPWANPLIFFPNGTLPDNMYWDPNLVWRLEIRRGPTQSDALIYEINNFVPCCSGTNPTPPEPEQIFTQDNQISNPQFSEISFVSPLTITTAGTYSLGPGWDLILTGSGTITITQLIFSGSQGITDNPPFGLQFNSSGWTTVILSQTFNNNGAIWNGGAIAGSLLGKAEVSPEVVTMNYVPSDSGTPVQIFQTTLALGNFTFEGGAVDIPFPSTNTDLSSVANVQIQIVLPPTGIVDISNIQITGQSVPLTAPLSPSELPFFNQETQERELDHKFHIFADQLITRPKENLLVGWNFGVNPWQFRDPTLASTATLCSYIADQTILRQETASSLKTGRSGANTNFGLIVQGFNNVVANRFALIQYIDPKTIGPYWGFYVSSMVRALLFTVSASVPKFKMRIIYRVDLPPTLSNTEPITGWDVNGDVTFAAGWSAIKPLNDPAYTISSTYDTNDGTFAFPKYSFNQFSLPASLLANPNSMIGVVIYTTTNIVGTIGSEDQIVFDNISLCPNKFAVEAPPQTFDESLRKCQFYYEKSYEPFIVPGTATLTGSKFAEQESVINGPNIEAHPRGFEIQYKAQKRIAAPQQIYSPVSGIAGNIHAYTRNGGAALGDVEAAFGTFLAAFFAASTSNAVFVPLSVASMLTLTAVANDPESFFLYHYTVDARLGT